MKRIIIVSLVVLLISSCNLNPKDAQKSEIPKAQNEALFKSVLEKHLLAVTNKDYTTLKSTMSPEGEMELIQPDLEIIF